LGIWDFVRRGKLMQGCRKGLGDLLDKADLVQLSAHLKTLI
jgi:hypothetical protein